MDFNIRKQDSLTPPPPLLITIRIRPGEIGHLEYRKTFQNIDLGQEVIFYNNWFDLEVIGFGQL